jgi:hypothetical protein
MQTGTESRSVMVLGIIKAITAGLATFIVVGGIVLGAAYVTVVYVLPRPNQWAELTMSINGMLAFLLAVGAGSVSGGYLVAKTSPRAPYVNSMLLAALLAVIHHAYLYSGLSTLWDMFADLYWGASRMWNNFFGTMTILVVFLPFFILGAWIGLRKRQRQSRTHRSLK